MGGLTGGNFAPADFLDADDNTPTGVILDIGGHGQSEPYTLAVNSILQKQLDEVRVKTAMTLDVPTQWKRRFREFMSKKNNELLEFLKVDVPKHPVFGPGEIILRKFGNPQVHPSHPSVRDMVLDASGDSTNEEINATLLSLVNCDVSGATPLKDYISQTQKIYQMYKESGENALRAQQSLKVKLDKLDRIQGKLSGLFDIEPNELFEPIMLANEAYLKKIYTENKIAEDYEALVKGYRQFIALRDIVADARTVVARESEPLCSICLEESVTFALNPCGHTFCQTCIRRQNGNCFVCRTAIRDRLKLYFG